MSRKGTIINMTLKQLYVYIYLRESINSKINISYDFVKLITILGLQNSRTKSGIQGSIYMDREDKNERKSQK